MVSDKNNKPWFRFFDGNKKYDYKSLYNAVNWAQRKVVASTSHQIRIFRLARAGRALELDLVAKVLHNRASPKRTVIGAEGEQVSLDRTPDGVTTVWRDIDTYNEYKEKEQWVSSGEED